MTRRRRRSKVVTAYRFIKRNPLLLFAAFVSTLTGYGTHRWLDVAASTQVYVMLLAFCAVLAAYAAASLTYGAVYVVMGLHPVTGRRVVLYVGLTTQRPYRDRDQVLRYPRIEQHLFGSDYYGTAAKSWSDTVTDWRFAHESWYFLRAILPAFEVINIRWRKPLYNDKWNRDNPRRIDKRTMMAQRAQRDRGIYTPEYWQAMQRNRPMFAQH